MKYNFDTNLIPDYKNCEFRKGKKINLLNKVQFIYQNFLIMIKIWEFLKKYTIKRLQSYNKYLNQLIFLNLLF